MHHLGTALACDAARHLTGKDRLGVTLKPIQCVGDSPV
jgi:hypothetical protein